MNPILIKVFATALALSQVTTRPEAIKTRFDPVADRAEVVELLRAGCAHMRKVFDIEDLNDGARQVHLHGVWRLGDADVAGKVLGFESHVDARRQART